MKWEYKKMSDFYSVSDSHLNSLGEEGWELIAIDKYNHGYLKRSYETTLKVEEIEPYRFRLRKR